MGMLRGSRVLRFLFFFGVLTFSSVSSPQEIPLKRCDALPVVEVVVAGQPMLFLVDTAANSMLNLKSFTEGKSTGLKVTSWTGTLATSAKEVTLTELVIGSTKLVGLRLMAIDLSAVGNACGRKIDGILGVDLLGKLGATIDMRRQLMHLTTVSEKRGAALAEEMQSEMHRCLVAFNESDEKGFADCLDPKIVLFTMGEGLFGREQVSGYFREKYFHQEPAAQLKIRESAYHPIGDAVWYEYEFTIESRRGILRGKGMAMCRKSEGRWRMASMHHAEMQFEPAMASAGSP
jgi:ketosteroid isomerase-like protein